MRDAAPLLAVMALVFTAAALMIVSMVAKWAIEAFGTAMLYLERIAVTLQRLAEYELDRNMFMMSAWKDAAKTPAETVTTTTVQSNGWNPAATVKVATTQGGRRSMIPAGRTLETVTAAEWGAASEYERQEFISYWALRGQVSFRCVTCGYPVDIAGSNCAHCQPPKEASLH